MAAAAQAAYNVQGALKVAGSEIARARAELDGVLVSAQQRALNVLKHAAESGVAPINCEGETADDREKLGLALQRGLEALQKLEAARLEVSEASAAASQFAKDAVVPPAGTAYAELLGKSKKSKKEYAALAVKSDRWRTFKDVPTIEAAVRKALGKPGNAADDGIEVGPSATQDAAKALRCPLSMMLMTKPVRNTICNHHYDESSILNIVLKGKATATCPIACCGKQVSRTTLQPDEQLALELEDYNRRKEQEKEEAEEAAASGRYGSAGASGKRAKRGAVVDDDDNDEF